MPVCDRCGHLPAITKCITKYTLHACSKKDKHLAKVHKERNTRRSTRSLARFFVVCDGLVVSATGDVAFEREKVEFMAQAELNRR
jgi:hypothetical protein